MATVGWAQRGQPGDGLFKAATGEGYVKEEVGAYAKALGYGIEVMPLLFETFGGFSPAVVELLRRAAEARRNKLFGEEYEDTSWAARTWTSYSVHRISCALMRAVAWETAAAMGLSRVRDTV